MLGAGAVARPMFLKQSVLERTIGGGRRCWESTAKAKVTLTRGTTRSVLISTLSRTGSYPQDATGVALGVRADDEVHAGAAEGADGIETHTLFWWSVWRGC